MHNHTREYNLIELAMTKNCYFERGRRQKIACDTDNIGNDYSVT